MVSISRQKGWRFESFRHGLSAKGIKTSKKMNSIKPLNLISNRLPIQFGLIVPSKDDNNKNIPKKEFTKRVNNTKKFFIKTFSNAKEGLTGGETSVRAEGGFSLDGKLIKEKVVIVESSITPKMFNARRKILEDHITEKQKEWDQNSLLYKIEGETFIYPRQSFIGHDSKRKNIKIS